MCSCKFQYPAILPPNLRFHGHKSASWRTSAACMLVSLQFGYIVRQSKEVWPEMPHHICYSEKYFDDVYEYRYIRIDIVATQRRRRKICGGLTFSPAAAGTSFFRRT